MTKFLHDEIDGPGFAVGESRTPHGWLAAFSLIATVLIAPACQAADLELRLASLDQTELLEEPAWGDRMTVTRPFGPWTLRCELSVSQNRRLCSVEQTVQADGGALFWRLGQSQDNRNVLIFSLPANMKPATGLEMRFGSVRALIDAWKCGPTACLALKLLSKPLQGLLLDSGQVDLIYETQSGQAVRLTSSLRGLQVALSAAADDPFGKQATVHQPMTIPVPRPRPNLMALTEAPHEHR